MEDFMETIYAQEANETGCKTCKNKPKLLCLVFGCLSCQYMEILFCLNNSLILFSNKLYV